jgi:tetratricopeptide (TPR) repeat protein
MDFLVRIDHLDTALALTEELKTLAESETVPPDAAASGYHALANLFSVCQRWNEAEAAFHAALTCWQRVKTDEGRAGAVSTHCQLARLHYARGQFAEAESSYLTLIQALEEEGPTAKRWLANVLADYAFLLEQTERPSAAAEMRKRAESLAQPRQQD